MGAVISIDENDSVKIHQKTYQLLKEQSSIQEQQKLIDGHSFCKSIYEHQSYFKQQLPFFQVKFLYVYASYLLYKLGIPLYDALFIVVLIASVCIILLIYNWLKVHVGNKLSLLFCVLLFLCWFNVRSFTISSPDAMAGLFFMLACYFYLERNNFKLTYLFLSLAALTRPDYLFFVLCFYVISNWVLKTKPAVISTISMLLCVASVVLISSIYHYNGWQMFYRSFVYLTVSPQTEAGAFSTEVYLNGLLNGVKISLKHWSTYLFLLMLMLPFIFLKRLTVTEKIIFLTVLTSVIVRFFIHPWLEERFVFIYIDLFIIIFFKHNGQYLINRKSLISQKSN
jgi:hypothetical protein